MADTTGVTSEEVADQIVGKIWPKNEDGTINETPVVDEEEAREIGTLDADSAAANKRITRSTYQKHRGDKNITLGDTDAINQFELVKRIFGNESVMVYITRLEPNPPMTYEPHPMVIFETAQHFYQHIVRTCHMRQARDAKYRVAFRVGPTARATGYLSIPGVQADAALPPAAAAPPPPPPAPPANPWGAPPGWFPSGQGTPPSPMGWPMGWPGVAAPPAPAAQAASANPPAPAPPPPAPLPPMVPNDPNSAALYHMLQMMMQQQSAQSQQQLELLREELHRARAAIVAPPAAPAPAPAQAPPPGYAVPYGMPQGAPPWPYAQPPHAGVAGPPQGPPPAPTPPVAQAPVMQAQPAVQATPLSPHEQIQHSMRTMGQTLQAAQEFRAMFDGFMPRGETEVVEEAAASGSDPDADKPYRTMEVGGATVALDKSGAVMWPATIMAALPVFGKIATDVMEKIGDMKEKDRAAMEAIEQRRMNMSAGIRVGAPQIPPSPPPPIAPRPPAPSLGQGVSAADLAALHRPNLG